MLEAFTVAAVLIALAELGDKTQMLTLMLACRYPARQVLGGVFVAVLALQLIATSAGRALGDLLPRGVLSGVTAILFVGFGIWSLRDAARCNGEEIVRARGRGLGPTLGIAAAFFVAEFGDKTQVLTVAVAADPGIAARALSVTGLAASSDPGGVPAFLGVWLGSTLGMMLVNGLAVAAGTAIGKRVRRSLVARVSGVLFIVFGIAALLDHVLG